ncbi:MAG: CoA transferase subunit A [Acidimicrobiales bacterium]
MTATVYEARLDLESHRRPVVDKRVSAHAAVGLVEDGDLVAIGGTLFSRTPMSLVFELLRSGRRDLTITRPLTCYEADLFLATGSADRLVTSWVGIGLQWGLSPVVRHYIEKGLAAYEEWSHLALGLRYKAGAMGVPFLPTMTMLGSDLERRAGVARVRCPYTGQELLAVPALVPDVALLHVHRADMYGNAQVDGYDHMDVDLARASRRVVISAEEIVTPEQIMAEPERTILPHFAVDAVVEAPFGAYPHECYGRYEADTQHFDDYVSLLRMHGPDEGVRRYVETNVMAHKDFDGFLRRVAPDRLAELERSARELTA